MYSGIRATYLIQDPYDEDALQFIRTIFTYFGLRPVCFYTDRKGRFYGERRYPLLTGDRIEARYDVDLGDLRSFAREVQQRHRVLGVVPYRENTVEVAAELCALLALDWNAPETVRRFRDKHALKSHVRATAPDVRVPSSRLVRTPCDVWSEPVPPRFVLKPNSGYGNSDVGIFERNQRDAVELHLARRPHDSWVLEEYISGPEYHINGQVRADGEVTILGLLQYVRAAINDYDTVYVAERQCRTSHPQFQRISAYARRLLIATGLRSSPFHLEVKVDEHGPCMFDLGARIPSEGGGYMLSRFHPNRPDVFAVAAHDYLGESGFARDPVDFTHYDRELAVLVYGISQRAGIIESLEGMEQVEALPQFVNWVQKPSVGDHVQLTTDLRSAPYIVELRVRGSDADAEALIARVRSAIRWNQSTSGTGWLRVRARDALRRAPAKLRWIAHCLRHRQ